ncbi:unnamed protein product [Ilex paraguariensis]|uniref:Shugoshin C-terminal domain-containing protein n=1 Tax=Ilex paraguariensis TaxID=185542 RepID=A0ABC8SR63_9AQUA
MVKVSKCEEAQEYAQSDRDDNKPCTTNRRRQSKSFGPSPVKQSHAKEDAESKRLCVRRHSARFKSEESKPTEDFFEIDEAKLPECPSRDDRMLEDGSATMSSLVKTEDKDESSGPIYKPQEIGRSSIGRPLRQAAKKVQSYKETPVNVKMRRPE